MKKSHYTYLLYNGEQFYIGVRSCNGLPENDYDYLSSSHDEDFSNSIVAKTILRTFKTRKEAVKHEIQLHTFHDVGVNPRFANKVKQTATGFCTQGKKLSKEHRAKISASNKGISRNKGKKLSREHRSKLSAANKGNSSHKGCKHSKETRAKISAANKGNSYSKGSKHSAEHRAKNSAARQGLNNPRADHTIYIFCNETTGEIFMGTRFEFKEKYKINVVYLFSKKHQRGAVKGWRATCKLL